MSLGITLPGACRKPKYLVFSLWKMRTSLRKHCSYYSKLMKMLQQYCSYLMCWKHSIFMEPGVPRSSISLGGWLLLDFAKDGCIENSQHPILCQEELRRCGLELKPCGLLLLKGEKINEGNG